MKFLAKAILKTVELYNASYDKAAADAATAENDAKRAAAEKRGESTLWYIVDYSKFQRMSIRQCAEQRVPASLVEPVYLLLELGWNDAIAWAQEQIARENFLFSISVDKGTDPDSQDLHEIEMQIGAEDEFDAAMKAGQSFEMAVAITPL